MAPPRKKKRISIPETSPWRLGRRQALQFEDTGLNISTPEDLKKALSRELFTVGKPLEETINDIYIRRLTYILDAEVELKHISKETRNREVKIWHDRLQTENIDVIAQVTPPPFWDRANPSISEVEWELAVNASYEKAFAQYEKDYEAFQQEMRKQAMERFKARSVLKPGEEGGVPELQWQTDKKTGKRFLTYSNPEALSMKEFDIAVRSREEQFGQMLKRSMDWYAADVGMAAPERITPITRSPRNWIEYWQMQRGINPDVEPLSKATRWDNYVARQNETLSNLESWSDFLDKNPPVVKGSSYYDLAQGIPTMIQAQQELVAQITKSEIPPASETSFHQAQPLATPMAESWLERLVPGQKAGQPLTKPSRVPTPSGQQWQNLLPSEREKFAGYLDWANVDIDDILFQMQRSLPETPAGAGRWNPVRQRSG